jgi:hypothetical protein
MLPVLSPSSDFVDTGSSGLVLCLFGCDIPEGRMKPLAIVISFDVSEQIVPGSIPGWVASLVHEFGFDRAKAAFHRGIVLTISRPAHGLDYPGCIEDLAVIGRGVLGAAIGSGLAAAFGVGWPWSVPRSSSPPACGHASPSQRSFW